MSRAEPECPQCNGLRASRIRDRYGRPYLEFYCRPCQAESAALWRRTFPDSWERTRAAYRARLRAIDPPGSEVVGTTHHAGLCRAVALPRRHSFTPAAAGKET